MKRAHWMSTTGFTLLASGGASLLAVTPSIAQSTASTPAASSSPESSEVGVGEVVVTARRRVEVLESVPVAITAVTGRQLERTGIETPADLIRVAPGLVTGPSSTRGYNQLIFAIRGQRNGDGTSAADPSVGVYFADVPQNSPQGLNGAFFDLSSVQVLKGPQGTLFGRNATAGAVLIEPQAPTQEFGGYLKGSVGDYNLHDEEGVVNVPLGDDLSIRAAFKATARDGYMHQIITNTDYDNIDAQSGRLSVKWTPNNQFSSTTIGAFSDSRSNGVSEKEISVTGAPITNPVIQASFLQYQNIGKYNFVNSYIPGAPFTDPRTADRVWSIQNTSAWQFTDNLTLKNIFGFRQIYDREAPDGDGTVAEFTQTPLTDRISEYSEELQLSGHGGIFSYVGGLYAFREDGNEQITSVGLITNPSPIGLPTATSVIPAEAFLNGDTENTSYSAYGDVTVDLSNIAKGLGLTAGVRISHDQRDFTSHSVSQTGPGSTTFTCLLTGVKTAPGSTPGSAFSQCNIPYHADFTQPTGEITLNYNLTPDSLIYASYRRGYRTGGFSITATNPVIAGTPYLPETVDAFEVGSKNEIHFASMSGYVNIAAYYDKYNDIQRQVTVFVPNGGPVTFFNRVVNAAEAHIYGGEFEFDLHPIRAIDLNLGYAYTMPVYDDFKDTQLVNGVAFPVDVSDSHFVNISTHQLNATVAYTLPLRPEVGTVVGSMNYSYRSEAWQFNEINSANCTANGTLPPGVIYVPCYNHNGVLPGYGLLNLRADWTNVFHKGFDLAFFVNNVTDKYYFLYGVNALGGSGQGSFYGGVGAPRMFGFELRVPFGAQRE
jgi:iron complex outermembrane recepter protein